VDIVRQRASLKISYGLLDDTTIDLMLPIQSIEIDDIGLKDSGLGDIELGIHQRVYSEKSKVWLSAGLALPTGNSDAIDNTGEDAHASLQLGRGAPDFMLSVKYLNPLSRHWNLYGDLTTRWGIGETDSEYQHGTVVDATVGGLRDGTKLDVFSHLLFEHAEADDRNGMNVKDTGGDIMYATLGLRYWLNDNCAVTLKNRFLVWDDVNGEQMLPECTIGFGVTFFSKAR
jgi:hypothetical protein